MWHYHLLWMTSIATICMVVLFCVFRRQIHLRIHGMTTCVSMESMTLLWSANGGNIAKINDILRSIYTMEGVQPHSWVYEFSSIAKKFYTKQVLLSLDEDKHTNFNQNKMQQVYYQASLWFGIAKYPHVFKNTSKMECYKLHKLCYTRAMEMNPQLLSFEEIKIPTHRPNKDYITGYLHKSMVSKKKDAAFVIIIGSIDVWKADVWFVVRQLLQHNISVFTMDLAGTGDNQYKLDKNTMYIYQDATKWFMKSDRAKDLGLNVSNLGVFGVGFGGHCAVRLAQHDAKRGDDDIKFVITLSAPLIYTFNSEWISQMDENMIRTCCFALDIKECNEYSLYDSLKTWRLNRYSDESLGKCKILRIAGGDDTFINPSDVNVFGNKENVVYFEHDGYCCGKSITKWMPKVVEWIHTI